MFLDLLNVVHSCLKTDVLRVVVSLVWYEFTNISEVFARSIKEVDGCREFSHLHTHYRENLNSYVLNLF
jgi:hypothetical protein